MTRELNIYIYMYQYIYFQILIIHDTVIEQECHFWEKKKTNKQFLPRTQLIKK